MYMFDCRYYFPPHFFNSSISLFLFSDEGSLDSPSDHPPISPKNLLSPEEQPEERNKEERNKVNGGSSEPDLLTSISSVKIKR